MWKELWMTPLHLSTHDSRDKDHSKLGSLQQDRPSPGKLKMREITVNALRFVRVISAMGGVFMGK